MRVIKMGMLCSEMKPVQRHTLSLTGKRRDGNVNGIKCVVRKQKYVNNIVFYDVIFLT